MTKRKIVKSVSFNSALPNEAEMIKEFSRKNFSRYVKKLMKADIEAKKAAKQKNAPDTAQNTSGRSGAI